MKRGEQSRWQGRRQEGRSQWTRVENGVSEPEHDELNAAALDQSLDRLRGPTTVQERLDILKDLVDFWHGPIGPQDGMTDADEAGGVRFPLPLRFWYGWAGKRTEIMTGQNILFAPRDYRHHRFPFIKRDRLHFYVENQGVYEWSTLPDGDDPPVFGRHGCRGRRAQEEVTLSQHLILVCLFEAIMCHAKYRASAAWLTAAQLDVILANVAQLGIPPWRWGHRRFFVRQGAFVCVADNGTAEGDKYYSIWLGAKTRQPLQFLKPLVDESWHALAI